ncbi:MAG: alpha-galactosidase [Treponema sp.]|jgi:alpha-galactosidase|nr:alpha-galactosidase [Treponema sp.]
MSKKIVFIGAGSQVFTRNLSRDILSFPALSDATLVLVDIDMENLALAQAAVEKIVELGKYPAKVIATANRAEALQGADGVLCTIAVGGLEAFKTDIRIPSSYNVSINIGDTRGPSGIFRYLRTWPVMLDILRDIEKYCPNAIFLNYTNPMAMLCRTMQTVSKVRVTGLCHSVQGTAEMLARWLGADMADVDYTCAGINHQAFYLKYLWKGENAYPKLRELMKQPEIYNEEQVRNEMFLHLGYYVTESSGHNSEYNAWFRKRKDLLEKYCTHGTGWNPGHDMWENIKDRNESRQDDHRREEFNKWIAGNIDLSRGHEFASYIFNACFGDHTVFEFNGNVRNFGLIDNLPEGCCVEVPVFANKSGFAPIHVGPLPPELAVLVNTSARCEELAVEGCLEGDPRKIFHACLYNPLTSAVCSMAEIQEMVTKLFEAEKQWLPQFKAIK